MSLFKNQTVDPISLDCGRDATVASVKQILYEKPDGTRGAWTATAAGNFITYTASNTETDQSGNWKVQSHLVIAGKVFLGKVVTITFLEPLL